MSALSAFIQHYIGSASHTIKKNVIENNKMSSDQKEELKLPLFTDT